MSFGNEEYMNRLEAENKQLKEQLAAAIEQTKKACAEAITISAQIDGYIGLRPSDIIDIIMKVKVE